MHCVPPVSQWCSFFCPCLHCVNPYVMLDTSCQHYFARNFPLLGTTFILKLQCQFTAFEMFQVDPEKFSALVMQLCFAISLGGALQNEWVPGAQYPKIGVIE